MKFWRQVVREEELILRVGRSRRSQEVRGLGSWGETLVLGVNVWATIMIAEIHSFKVKGWKMARSKLMKIPQIETCFVNFGALFHSERIVMKAFFLIIGMLAGCASQSKLMSSPPEVVDAAVAPDPSVVGMTGIAANSFLQQKVIQLRSRVDPIKAQDKIRKIKKEEDSYKTQANISAVITVTTGSVIAALSDYAVAGGVISALAGGYSLYVEKQRDADEQVEIGECMAIINAGPDIIDNYNDKWSFKFLSFGDTAIPMDMADGFMAETIKTNAKIRELGGKCI